MARKLRETMAKLKCGLKENATSDPTISRFFQFLGTVIDRIFRSLAGFAAILGIHGVTFLIDTTSI